MEHGRVLKAYVSFIISCVSGMRPLDGPDAFPATPLILPTGNGQPLLDRAGMHSSHNRELLGRHARLLAQPQVLDRP